MLFSDLMMKRTRQSTRAVEARALLGLLHLESGADYGPGQAMLAWVLDLLISLGVGTDEQRWLLLEHMHESIIRYGESLEKAIEEKASRLPVTMLGFADRRYAILQGRDEFLDLETGKWLPYTKLHFLELLFYNLATLFVRKRLECLKEE